MKRADRSEAEWVIILGDDELAAEVVSVKHLRDASIAQQNVAMDKLATWLRDRIISN
jgi:histidyl-tRNA synthetase